MEFSRSKKSKVEISLIPLVNVIFLLLIFFMVAGTIEGVDIFEVELPASEDGQLKPTSASTVYLSEDGRIAVNNDVVVKEDLKTILSTLFINNPEQIVVVKSDLNVPADTLIFIMNSIEDAGGTEISLVTQAGK